MQAIINVVLPILYVFFAIFCDFEESYAGMLIVAYVMRVASLVPYMWVFWIIAGVTAYIFYIVYREVYQRNFAYCMIAVAVILLIILGIR